MSNRVLVDASVAVKWLVKEEDVDGALRLLEGADEIRAPQILFVEVANALWKKVRRGEIAGETGLDAIRLLRNYIQFAHPTENLLADALSMACALDHPVYDCLYVACARHLDLPLVTADARMIRKFGASSFASSVIPLSDWRP